VADLDLQRRDDVALLGVHVIQQGDAGRAVGVILDSRHFGRHVELVALEINDPVVPARPAAAVANADGAGEVTAAVLAQRAQQPALGRALGDLLEGGAGHAAPTRRGGLVNLDGHYFPPSNRSMVWSARTVTTAFLYSWPRMTVRRPYLPRRPRLAGETMTFT